MNKTTVAAAVALALGTATAAHAQNAACATPSYKLYVAGSSAAKPAFKQALATDLFSSVTSYSSSNGDFEAFCGPVSSTGASKAGLTSGNYAVVYYRPEGGSVVGALPVISGNPIKFLDLTGPGCNTANPSTTGSSINNGTTDTWGGCVTSHGVELGVTDLEPSVFLAASQNYPTAYSTAAFGSATPAQLASLAGTAIPLFQQVFGIFVNTQGLTNPPSPFNLSKETVAAILQGPGNYTDWSAVPSTTGGAMSSAPAGITIINREAGSGTRTGASLYFLGQECTKTPATLYDPGPDAYATSDALSTAAATPGAITYASIDNNGKQSNLTLAYLGGVQPTNLAAAAGQYDWWFEATAIKGNTTGKSGGVTSPGGAAIENFLIGGELQALATAPHAVDINVIPGQAGNTAAVPLASSTLSGASTIFVNPFTRGGNSCNIPAEQN